MPQIRTLLLQLIFISIKMSFTVEKGNWGHSFKDIFVVRKEELAVQI
jgi:hypothetical protein